MPVAATCPQCRAVHNLADHFRGHTVLCNGWHWTTLPSLTVALPAKVRIGVAAVKTAQQPLGVCFENLRMDR